MGAKSSVNKPGDIDLIRMEGSVKTGYELKNIDFSSNNFRSNIGSINRGFEDLVAEGTIDDYKIVFRNEPPASEISWLNSNSIPWDYFVK